MMRLSHAAFASLLLLCSASCPAGAAEQGAGAALLSGSTRIVGGVPVTDPAKYPWMAGLVKVGEADLYKGQFCGGTLINSEWVLTAAHCTHDKNLIFISSVDVVLGTVRLNTPNAGSQRIRSKSIHVHPDYNAATTDNDIALIKLSTPSSHAAVASLAASDADTAAGLSTTVIGWGNTIAQPDPNDLNSYPTQLQEVDVPIVANAICYPGTGYVTANMICAGLAAGGKDSCDGDSGGPMVRPLTGGGHMLTGVVSWGSGCAQAGAYGVYTKVSLYRNWIDSIINPPQPPPATGVVPVGALKLLL